MKTWITPVPALREFVTHYVVLETRAPLASPMIATTEVVLAFGPGHRGVVFDHRSGDCRDAPPVAVVGPRTQHLVDLRSSNGFSGLFVTFAPGAFSRLFGVDVSELCDQSYPAEDVLGCDVLALSAALNNAESVREKISEVETFLLPRSAEARDERATHRAARSLKITHGRLELGQLVHASGVSERQFRREFVAQLGMSPKHYARVLRFEYALRLKDSRPWMTWAQISQEAGYYDQMHLVKDCKSLGAAPPTGLAHLATNPLLTLSDESLPTIELTLRRA
jgi:AraC-like DNA-binding protein